MGRDVGVEKVGCVVAIYCFDETFQTRLICVGRDEATMGGKRGKGGRKGHESSSWRLYSCHKSRDACFQFGVEWEGPCPVRSRHVSTPSLFSPS
jgi:hypothetical protein